MKTRYQVQQPCLKSINTIILRCLKITLIFVFIHMLNTSYSQTFGQKIIYTYEDIQLTTDGTTVVTKTLDFTHPLPSSGREIKSVKIFRELSTGEDYELGENDFFVELSAEVNLIQGLAGVVLNCPTQEFMISQDKPQETHFLNVSDVSQIDVVGRIEVKVSKGTIEPTSGDINTYLQNQLGFTVNCEIEYGWDASVFVFENIEKVEVDLSKKQQRFRWNFENSDRCYNYQLQLLRLFNKDLNFVTSPEHIKADIDWSKALTIETERAGTGIELTIAEGSGYYIWRVRPIGNYHEGGINNEKNLGEWSTSTAFAEIELQPGFTNSDCFYYVDADEDINWIYSRTFTEGESRISENIAYATPLQNVRQSQKYITSIGHKIVTQIVPDYSGRPAVTSLPIPLEGEITGYQESFMQNTSSKLFSAADFDLEANYENPDAVEMTGEFIYYNGNNGYVPSAQGFPYQRTLYLNDGSSRVIEQSGVGKTHSIGNAVDRGKTIKTLYGQPSQTELDKVFGDEAPDVSKVSKVITIDQNNVTSISYKTLSGKILATCLLYDDSNNSLLPLEGYGTTTFDADHLIKGNSKINDALISTSHLVLEEDVNIDIKYRLPIPNMEFSCGDIYLDCNYTLYVNIYNTQTQTSVEDWVVPVSVSQGTTLFEHDVAIGYSLPKGEYIIEKILVPGGKEDFLVDIDDAMSIDLIVDYVVKELEKVTDPSLRQTFYQNMIDFSIAFNKCAGTSDCGDLYAIESAMSGLEITTFHSFNLQKKQSGNYMNVLDYADIENLAQGELTYIFIESSCCQDIRVPILFEKMFDCPEQDEIASYQPQFAEYLEALVTPEEFISLMGGYTAVEFNNMIKEMLEYGETDPGTGDFIPYYYCNDLWACWINTIKANTGFADPDYSNIHISDSVDTHDQNYNQSGQNDHDNLFDDKSNFRMPGGWALRLIIKWFKLSTKVRAKSSNAGNGLSFDLNLPEYFLDCAGYRFAKVLVDGDPNPETDYNPNRSFYNGGYNLGMVDPNIKDRVYAFKYFWYDENNTNGGMNNACEMLSCFEADNTNYCHNIEPCTTGKEVWDHNDRKDFLDCLRNMGDASVAFNSEDMRTCAQIVVQDYSWSWGNLIIELEETCQRNCEENRESYKNIIKNYFELRCYTIDGCVTDHTSVSMDVIDHLADKMVLKCKSFCDIQGDIECTEIPCYDLMDPSITHQFTRLRLDDPCDDLTLKVSEWFLEFDVFSVCDGPPPPDYLCGQSTPLTGTVEDFREFGTGVMKDIQHTRIDEFNVTDTEGVVTSPD